MIHTLFVDTQGIFSTVATGYLIFKIWRAKKVVEGDGRRETREKCPFSRTGWLIQTGSSVFWDTSYGRVP